MKMPTKNLLIFGITLAISWMFPASAQVTNGSTLAQQTYGAWTSLLVFNKQDIRYRALTTGSDGSTTLFVDEFAPSCKFNILFGFPLNAPLDNDTASIEVQLYVRVDSADLYQMTGSYKGVMGDKFGFISLDITPKFTELLQTMEAGNTLRVKFQKQNGAPISTVAFSLNGFRKSLNRIQGACQQAENKTNQNAAPAPPSSPKPRTMPGGALSSYL